MSVVEILDFNDAADVLTIRLFNDAGRLVIDGKAVNVKTVDGLPDWQGLKRYAFNVSRMTARPVKAPLDPWEVDRELDSVSIVRNSVVLALRPGVKPRTRAAVLARFRRQVGFHTQRNRRRRPGG